MFDSCFVPFKLDYAATKDLAVRDNVAWKEFSAGGYLWSVRCYPRGFYKDAKGEYLSIYLKLKSAFNGVVDAVVEAFVMGKDGAPSSIANRLLCAYSSEDDVLGWPRFVKRNDLESLVVDGCVTIVCGVIVVRDDRPLAVPPSDIGHDLGEHDFADGSVVSIVVGGETFAAHRALLAARSRVFKAELFVAMSESRLSPIELQDIEAETFEVLLRFMYTDVLPKYNDFEDDDSFIQMYQHLLAAADRYAMDRLKMMCANKLWDNVSVDTITAVLDCAMTYNCLELKTKCIALFVEDEVFKSAIMFTDGYVKLGQKFPSIVAELRARAMPAGSRP